MSVPSTHTSELTHLDTLLPSHLLSAPSPLFVAAALQTLCMVKPLKMVELLFSVHSLPDQCLLHIGLRHVIDLPMYLLQAPAVDNSHQEGGEGPALLSVSLVTNEPT